MSNNSNGNSSNDTPKPMQEDFETTTPSESIGTESRAGKTAGQKNKGNRNAMKHGLYSKFVILPDESESEFNALLEDLHAEWQPHGRSEFEAVFDLGYLTLIKQRFRKWAQTRFQISAKNNFSLDTKAQEQSPIPFIFAQFKDVSEVLARLDAQIDKTLRRLTSLKILKYNEPKLFEPLPQTESPSTAPDDTPETDAPTETAKTETGQS